MQLLQQRDFSSFFSDTFNFIKENGKHFFTNYFIINGIFLLIQLVKNYYVGQGVLLPVIFELLYVLLAILFGVLNWTFVTIYLILYNERGIDFDYKDILNYYKGNVGKIIVFILVSFIIMIPAVIVFYIALLLSLITIVGPFIVYAAFILWFSLSFYEYLYTNKGIFDCYGYGWTLLAKKFWATTGSTALLLVIILIIYMVALGFTGVFSSFIEMNTDDPLGGMKAFQRAFSAPATLIVLTFMSVLVVLLQISQGIIYFSQKELLENISTSDDIDQIGKIEF